MPDQPVAGAGAGVARRLVDEVVEVVPVPVEHLERDGLRFAVRDRGPGDGPVAVLLHGFPQTSAAWDGVEPRLHALGLRTLALDQRGYAPGARPRGRRPYVLAEAARDVLALLDAAGLPAAHVVGHDWGGAVAWRLGARHPGRVRSLTVLSTPHPAALARSLLSSPQLLRSAYVGLFQLPALPERLLAPSPDGAGRLRRVLVATGLDEGHATTYERALAEPGALSAALAWYRALPLQPPRPLAAVPVPTRYLWGERDPFLGRRAAELTGRHVDADYRFLPLAGAGHWLPEGHPGAVADAVAELLALS